MIYLKNNTEKQRIFIPKNGEYQGKKSYREGYEEGVEVGKAEQKSFLEPIVINENGIYENENGYSVVEVNVEGEVCPELEDVVISANGEYEGAFGKVIVDVPQEELEEINITENGIYEGAYDRVIVDVPQEGGDINPDTLREITITENGVYTSKYSTPIEKEVTGIFDDGSPFYGYGELNGIIYDTQINLNDIGVLESLEFWYKGDGQDVGDGWNIILASNSEDSANEGCVEFRYASGNENYVRIGGDERSFQLEEGVWHHFKLNKTGDDICTLFVDDVEKESFPLPTATSTNFYINSSYYDANGDGWEGNRNANGCFGMIKIDDQTFVPTENGFINYNTQEPLPVVKAGDYSYNTTDIKLEGEPYKTINVDVQPNLASLDVTLTQNGSYNLGVEDGVDGYNRGTIVVDVPTKVGSITITENGTYYPQDETIKFLMFDGDDVFDLGQGFFIEDVANMVLLTINFKWVGDETGEPMNICGVENSDWDSESCFAIRYYDGNFSAKVGSFEMNLPADNEWHHMEIAYRSGVGYIVFDGSLYQEELGNFNKPTGNIYVGATNTGGEIFRPFRGYISDVVISGNIDRISYTPIDNGFRGSNGEEITDNIGGGYCDLDEEPIPNTAPIGYNEIHVNVPQEGGGCNLEPLWVTPYWENRDESNYVHYNPSEGMNGFDSAHIDLYPVHEDGKQEAINGLGHLVATEQKTYTAQKETKTRKYVHLDGDDYFEINTFLSHTNKIEFELMRYDLERRMILGNPTCYFAFDLEGLVANYRGKYTNPIPVENVKWVKVTMTTDYGLEVISEYGKRSEPWQGDFIYPNIEDNFTIGEGFGDYERNFGGNISTIEIHDNENNIQVVEPWQDGFYQGVFIIGETIYENQGGGTATYGEESYDIGVDGWKSVEVNVQPKINIAEAGVKFTNSTFSSVPEWADFEGVTDMSNMFKNCDYITTIPVIDTSNAVNMSGMFESCNSLTSIPMIDTSNVTDMSGIFVNCYCLTTIPQLDTSNVTEMNGMFQGCISLASIPLLDTSNAVNMSGMFANCEDLVSIPLLDTSNVNSMPLMFVNCENLVSIPLLDTSNVNSMNGMFGNCKKLTSIPRLDVSNVNAMTNTFQDCPNLTDIGGLINLKVSIDISDTEKLTRESVLNIFNDMAVVDNNQVIKLHENVYSQLTADDIAIATQKGWSVEIGKYAETEGGGDYEEENGEA